MTIIEYCTEEVRRQGHDTAALEGFERVGWMLDAWACAVRESRLDLLKGLAITESDVAEMGAMVEREKNADGFRTCNVHVGAKAMPPWPLVPELMADLLRRQRALSPLEFYRAFLEVHPFEDGNGRVGKVLLNWKNGTLLRDPVFPPADFWGASIVNP